MFSVKDKVCVITGGGGILCGNMALNLARAGAKTVLLDLRPEGAQKYIDEIIREGGSGSAYACNVLDKENVNNVCTKVIETYGKIDVLINGAGGNSPKGTTDKEFFEEKDLAVNGKDFFNLDIEGFKFTSDLNFIGTLIPTQVFARHMAAQKNGCVINISSMAAFKPLTKAPAYAAAKASVSNFTMWLAVYLGMVNVRVNAIAPGFFLTDQNRFLLTTQSGDLTERGKTIIAHTPQRRFGTNDDLISTLFWLISDKSCFVNGSVIPVDGGFSAFSGV